MRILISYRPSTSLPLWVSYIRCLEDFFIASGVLAAFATIGHLTIGIKSFLSPMRNADFGETPKMAMHCVFHFITVDFALSAAALLLACFRVTVGYDLRSIALFVALHFALYGIVQIVMVVSSKMKRGLMKIFQCTLFLLIAVVILLGVVTV